MEVGTYGWNRNISIFGQHTTFLPEPAPKTGTHGILNLGNASFDGQSPNAFKGAGTYSYDSGTGTALAMNMPSDFTGRFIDIQIDGISYITLGNWFGSNKLNLFDPYTIALFGAVGAETVIHPEYMAILGDDYSYLNLAPGPIAGSTMISFAGTGNANYVNNATTDLTPVTENWYYAVNGTATSIFQKSDGTIRLQVAPSGVGGNAITWTDALVVQNSGVVTTTDQVRTGKLWGTDAIAAWGWAGSI